MNTSGYVPTEHKVLVKRRDIEETTAGGIIIPHQTQEREKFATMEGQIVAVSHLAFTYADPEEWGDHMPKPGDTVLVAKYSGVDITGKDGVDYTLVNDKDVMAFVKEG